MKLSNSWARAWSGLDAIGEGLAVRDAVLAAYAEPHRHYHSLQHLQECVELFDTVREAADHPAAVEMAIWFHDAVYAIKRSDNEARSAAWAKTVLLQAGVPTSSAELVSDLILVTKHSGVPRSRDEQALVDVDLAILGAAPGRFAQYERQIREEYAHVPGFLFRVKRRSILKSFLDRESIYSVPALHQQLEARARFNLAQAIA